MRETMENLDLLVDLHKLQDRQGPGNDAARELVRAERHEIALYERCHACCGYGVSIARRAA